MFTLQDVEILVSTMYRDSLVFLEGMFPGGSFSDYNILVINQTDAERELVSSYPNVKVVNSAERGLSNSRNQALQHALGKLCVIADDDVVFRKDFAQKIVNAYNEQPHTALMVFRAEDGNGKAYKNYPVAKHHSLSQLQRLSVMSIEMVVNLPLVKQAGVEFDRRFGLGSTFTMGEEAVFVNALHKKGLTILAEPEFIVQHPAEDTHKRVSVSEKYYVQGALFTALFGTAWLTWTFIKIAFEIKNKKLSLSQVAVALKAAYKGRKALLRYE
ncbi:glycosyltransferase [Flavobacterium sp. RHBU_3]|uniref:glycosyltransferase n=1 Tax=Flavobacterium sp. RHBU_3 TaxID=3391184 RepID=UPI0039850AA2